MYPLSPSARQSPQYNRYKVVDTDWQRYHFKDLKAYTLYTMLKMLAIKCEDPDQLEEAINCMTARLLDGDMLRLYNNASSAWKAIAHQINCVRTEILHWELAHTHSSHCNEDPIATAHGNIRVYKSHITQEI